METLALSLTSLSLDEDFCPLKLDQSGALKPQRTWHFDGDKEDANARINSAHLFYLFFIVLFYYVI